MIQIHSMVIEFFTQQCYIERFTAVLNEQNTAIHCNYYREMIETR